MTREQVPEPPLLLRRMPKDVITHDGPVWRVQRDAADPARAWDRLRHYGPVGDQRFDPQEEPQGAAKPQGVQYLGTNPLACIGEVFQQRAIPTGDPSWVLYGWRPTRTLRLLDIQHTFAARNGATASFSTWPDKRRTRAWARAIDEQFPDVDGVAYQSKVSGYPAIALLTAAEHDPPWPAVPDFAREFTSAAMRPLLEAVAEDLGYALLP